MTESDKLKALLVMMTGLLVLGYFFDAQTLVYISMGIGLVSLIVPVAGDYIVKLWYKLAEILGWINSRILLGLIFSVFLVPIAFLSRLGKKDLLGLRRTKNDSVFHTRNHTYEKKDLENIW